MAYQRGCYVLFGLSVAAVLLASPAAASDECEEVDFPIFDIPLNKQCSSPADCGHGERCERATQFGSNTADGPVCSDFTADFLQDCDDPDGPRMASPGCKQNAGLRCDVHYNFQQGELLSAVCRREHGGDCSSNSDCIEGSFEPPNILCIEEKCQKYGYVQDCGAEGDRCPGGQVCTRIDTSTPTYACFNRGDRGDPCKAIANDGYKCKEENEVGYKLLCEGSEETAEQQYTLGVCKSFVTEIGAACDENIMCTQSQCIDGTCQVVDEPARDECTSNTDCDSNTEAPDLECLNGFCRALGWVGSCFSNGDTCPGGQTCWDFFGNDGRPSCINRAAKGEACKSPRVGPFNAYACKPSSETGYDMSCVFGADAVAVPGPGPGGAGGGVAGTGVSMQRVDDGAACSDATPTTCQVSSQCVDGTCQRMG